MPDVTQRRRTVTKGLIENEAMRESLDVFSPSEDANEEILPDIVDLPIEDVLDLHTFRPNEIKSLVEDYLHEAYARGFSEVRIIHGKGLGVQREIVRSVARRTPYVESVRLALEEAGSWGASIIRFRPRP